MLRACVGRRGMCTMINSSHSIVVNENTRVISILPVKKHTATVLLLHGLGDTGAGWADAAAYLSNSLPHVGFVLPTAPQQPVTLNGGMRMHSWYDIHGLNSRDDELCEGLDQSANTIRGLIEDQVGLTGIGSDRIVLAGFSQGAALSLWTGFLSSTPRVAGIVAMSGYIPRPQDWSKGISTAGKSIPVLQCHGDDDQMVQLEMAAASVKLMETAGINDVQYNVYPGMGHTATQQELDHVQNWLASRLPE
eukprot:TRINITY_DN29320_c0_g1_i1.p1 TRINITY_DN29320_c0_g1~~TRINITY_DN29320_c0_g1_i1.p1  ORF type:complete len:249 (+),score=38.14 TRINITY_DN29320_c0_g1_i1:228-974(+)